MFDKFASEMFILDKDDTFYVDYFIDSFNSDHQ